jgi:hypothetical protein
VIERKKGRWQRAERSECRDRVPVIAINVCLS